MSIKETSGGVILSVFVKPNSAKFKIELDGGEVVVYATEAPEKGKVNKEIIKELTKLFHAPIELVSGATSKEKKLFVGGIGIQEIQRVLTKV